MDEIQEDRNCRTKFNIGTYSMWNKKVFKIFLSETTKLIEPKRYNVTVNNCNQ